LVAGLSAVSGNIANTTILKSGILNTHTFRAILYVLVLSLSSQIAAAPPAFRRHRIDPQGVNPACAVFDVNGDGKKDIVSGGWWYEAPAWKKRFLRRVERIRGRNDDYSNLPLDVNCDGFTDLVSVNYRSQSLYWVEHPGRKLLPNLNRSPPVAWKKHEIDRPGPSETGLLADVDGDGDADILPNGVKFAAWYELKQTPAATKASPEFIKHALPPGLAAHGIGFGDIDGDGRADLVNPRGWYGAPAGRINQRWSPHLEFQLHRDASVPILVHDVDSDGDADLIWGRGHQAGLYWLEQHQDKDNKRQWRQHTIDTSFSQVHSLLLADLNNDGRAELIAGKRYMGHDGKDPGEYNPLVIYCYEFDKSDKVWRRGDISPPGDAGFDLNPAAADIDGDGDIDIVAAGRNGLSLFENLHVSTGDFTPPQTPAPPAYTHARLDVFKDAQGVAHAIDSQAGWAQRRFHLQQSMQQVMGPLPGSSRRVPLDVKTTKVEDAGKYTRHWISLAAEQNRRIPALLLIPKNLQHRAPAMLCLHPTSALGKSQIAGLGGKPSRFYAHELAEAGFVCIAPDYPSFGEYKIDFSTSTHASGTMQAIWDNHRAVDLLESLPEVDPDRIGCIGHSLGGHNALFTAVFDPRLKAIAVSCSFTAFAHYKGGNLAGWTSDRYMPAIARQYGNDPAKVPFDFHEIVGAIAPRGLFINAPLGDSNFDHKGVLQVVKEASRIYQLTGKPQQLRTVYPDVGHDYPAPVRRQTYEWLKSQLGGK